MRVEAAPPYPPVATPVITIAPEAGGSLFKTMAAE
jgi:hypothetical protein